MKVLLLLLLVCITLGQSMDYAERAYWRGEVKEMFYHVYNNYMELAHPRDELCPVTCRGQDSLGGYAVTLVDALDTLLVLGNHTSFCEAVAWVVENLHFDIDKNVSVFETNIRMMGALLSSYTFLDEASQVSCPPAEVPKEKLLSLAFDLGERLLPAFDTPTGIPYGTVNLRHGVPRGEIDITCLAGAGTFSLEFGLLSRLSGDWRFDSAARRAVRALWAARTPLNLVGTHINITSGQWTHREAGVGAGADSFYEYLFKAAILFDDAEYRRMFDAAYAGIMSHCYKAPWYVDVEMSSGVVTAARFANLQGFWPGLQVLYGDVENATRTLQAFFEVWTKYGAVPEYYNLLSDAILPGWGGYPLRPELAESMFYLHAATENSLFLEMGRDMISSLQAFCRTSCGFASIKNVVTMEWVDHMDSYFLAETLKYLYLLFDDDSFVRRNLYIFNTEGHLFPISYRWRQTEPVETAAVLPLHNGTCAVLRPVYEPLRWDSESLDPKL